MRSLLPETDQQRSHLIHHDIAVITLGHLLK
jgi:hypothetical protein